MPGRHNKTSHRHVGTAVFWAATGSGCLKQLKPIRSFRIFPSCMLSWGNPPTPANPKHNSPSLPEIRMNLVLYYIPKLTAEFAGFPARPHHRLDSAGTSCCIFVHPVTTSSHQQVLCKDTVVLQRLRKFKLGQCLETHWQRRPRSEVT